MFGLTVVEAVQMSTNMVTLPSMPSCSNEVRVCPASWISRCSASTSAWVPGSSKRQMTAWKAPPWPSGWPNESRFSKLPLSFTRKPSTISTDAYFTSSSKSLPQRSLATRWRRSWQSETRWSSLVGCSNTTGSPASKVEESAKEASMASSAMCWMWWPCISENSAGWKLVRRRRRRRRLAQSGGSAMRSLSPWSATYCQWPPSASTSTACWAPAES
mmetsp:Transcript_141572/g.452610  ORF Transcript_141572/g.452610 Transcript_141572/m.452610 type:complete len:216 (-) Transcript_141572:363-1010(-)